MSRRWITGTVLALTAVVVGVACSSGREDAKTKAAFAEIDAVVGQLQLADLGSIVNDTAYGALKFSSDLPSRVIVVAVESGQRARDQLNQRLAGAGWRQSGSCLPDTPCTYEIERDGHRVMVTSTVLDPGATYPVQNEQKRLPAGRPGLLVRVVAAS